MKAKLFTDGGSRGNPGKAAAGIVLYDDNGKVIDTKGMYLGVTTNNIAEYKGIILGLETAIKNNIKKIDCFMDSELIIKQLNGQYKVKNQGLRELYNQVNKLKDNFEEITFTHVLRSKNKNADLLVNKVLDMQNDN